VLPGEVLKIIQKQLDWRGPTGKPLGHIVLSRVQAEALMTLPALVYQTFNDGFDKLLKEIPKAE
jgi:hypothetical protein